MKMALKQLPVASERVLLFWDTPGRVDELRECLRTATDKQSGLQRSRLVVIAGEFAPDEPALDYAVGRFTRNNKEMQRSKYHVFTFALYYAFQNIMGPSLKDSIALKIRSSRLFERYDEWLAEHDYPIVLGELEPAPFTVTEEVRSPSGDIEPPLSQASEASHKTSNNEGVPGSGAPPQDGAVVAGKEPVNPKPGLAAVGALHDVLNLVNIEPSMHHPANARLFQVKPHITPDYIREWYIVVTQPPGFKQFRLSLLVLRSGHERDWAITYTHRQLRKGVMSGQSNGVLTPSNSGMTLFGGFETGSATEYIFIPGEQVGRDRLVAHIHTLDQNGLPFFGDGLLLRSEKPLWDTNDWYLKQDLSLCGSIIAKPLVNVGDLGAATTAA